MGDTVGNSVSLTTGTPAAESADIGISLALTRKGRFQHGGSIVAVYKRQRAIITFLGSEG